MNHNRHHWKNACTGTLTLEFAYTSFEDWADQVNLTEEEANYEDLKKIFTTLYTLYGDSYTKMNTLDKLSPWMYFILDEELEKYNKYNSLWDKQINELVGTMSETNAFKIGDLVEDPDNFDKYKNGRVTNNINTGLLNKIDQLEKMKTPFTALITRIVDRLFIAHNKDVYGVEV